MNKQLPDVMLVATEWYVTLSSGAATEQDIQTWQTWLNAHQDHLHAWQQLETVSKQFSAVDASSGLSSAK